MIRRPPRSTPFPTRRSSDLDGRPGDEPARGLSPLSARAGRARPQGRVPQGAGRVAEGRLHPRAHRDRKSTRLNSSHANISYAVFCLKKKKKNRTYLENKK